MTTGVCFFAYNNEQIDYVKLALYAASQVKKHLNQPVCLITDEGGLGWLKQSQGINTLQKYIDDVVITEDEMKPNTRVHNDSPWTEFRAQFSNSNKHKVFEYSPYDQTLLLDIDYIVKSDFLNHSWDRYDGVSMFSSSLFLDNNPPSPSDKWLFKYGIKMWWSTVVYFDKSEKSKMFFDLWEHIADNYSFYQQMYNFPGKMFRTDYCVSIAAHILSGMQDGDVIENFSGYPLHNMSQKDDIVKAIDSNSWAMLVNNRKEPWKNILTVQEDCDIHVMNKRALGRVIDQVGGEYGIK